MGNKVAYWIVGVILFLIVGAGLFRFFYDPTKAETPKVYQCNDGRDNDGDRLTDYPSDPDCSSAFDNLEKKLPSIWWLVGIIGVIVVIWVGYYVYTNKKAKDDDDDLRPEPVEPDRVWEIVQNNLLKTRFSDIPSIPRKDRNGDYLLTPLNDNDLKWLEREAHVIPSTGNEFQYDYFGVEFGKDAGLWVAIHCITKGERYLKGGVRRLRKSLGANNFSRMSRTFNLDSPVSEKARMNMLALEATRDGDSDTASEINAIMKSLNSNYSSPDEDETEFRERLRIENMNKINKKKTLNKSKKASSGSQQPQVEYNNYNEGGDEE